MKSLDRVSEEFKKYPKFKSIYLVPLKGLADYTIDEILTPNSSLSKVKENLYITSLTIYL